MRLVTGVTRAPDRSGLLLTGDVYGSLVKWSLLNATGSGRGVDDAQREVAAVAAWGGALSRGAGVMG